MNVTEEDLNGLERTVWGFWVHESCGKVELVFDYYYVERRPTKRHKWKRVEGWDRLRHGRGDADFKVLARPELPPAVALLAKTQLEVVVVEDWDAL